MTYFLLVDEAFLFVGAMQGPSSIIQMTGTGGRQPAGTLTIHNITACNEETGITNAIVTPDLYERDRLVVTPNSSAEGILQNQDEVNRLRPCGSSPLQFRF
jgi:hypothetical protein